MYRAVLTLLVGLMLSLSGGASALTFKSDGSVVQSDGTVLKKADVASLPDERICSLATLSEEQENLLGIPISSARIWRSDESSIVFINEAMRRKLSCNTNQPLTANKVHGLSATFWKPEAMAVYTCELKLKAVPDYTKKEVESWLPQISEHVLRGHEAHWAYGSGEVKNISSGRRRISYIETDSIGRFETIFELEQKTGEVTASMNFVGYTNIENIRGNCEVENMGALWPGWFLLTESKDDTRSTSHLVITNILGNSPAFAAGLQKGDVIAEINGFAISNYDEAAELLAAIYFDASTESVDLLILRNRQKRNVTLRKFVPTTLDELFFESQGVYLNDAGIGVGMTPMGEVVKRYFSLPTKDGALVADLITFGPAGLAGMRVGDLIIEIDGQKVDNPQMIFDKDFKPGRAYEISFYRKEHKMKLNVVAQSRTQMLAASGVSQVASASSIAHSSRVSGLSNKTICSAATADGRWETRPNYLPHVKEAKRRGLTCGVVGNAPTTVASASSIAHSSRVSGLSNKTICSAATADGRWETRPNYLPHVKEAKRRGLTCGVINSSGSQFQIAKQLEISDFHLCQRATRCGKGSSCNPKIWIENQRDQVYVEEAKRRGLRCGVGNANQTQIADAGVNNAELLAAQARAAELEKRLALLEAKEELVQRQIASDNQAPLIDITSVNTVDKQGVIEGYVTDNTGVAEVMVDGTVVPVTSGGTFEYKTFVPANGISVQVQATDLAGLTSVMSVSLERSISTATASITFDRLNPLGKQVATNRDALALIVGVADYENTPAKAIFADSDALMFRDYASEKLGIPENRIKTLVDDGADERQLLLSVKNWLSRAIRQNQSDVYIFFAGHGLASDDGEKMYLLPYDGAPELLENTAILRDELFSDIAAANPRSVTVFLDTCYSGATRGKDVLLASRPIAIRAKEQAVPDGFTVMTAAAGDQTAKPLEEAKHGMFSYFLMKGMEGDADANQDNQITAGELHAYVQQNVIQQSSGSQTPELQGDADRVLVRFQ